jgi:hypothetical protein
VSNPIYFPASNAVLVDSPQSALTVVNRTVTRDLQ